MTKSNSQRYTAISDALSHGRISKTFPSIQAFCDKNRRLRPLVPTCDGSSSSERIVAELTENVSTWMKFQSNVTLLGASADLARVPHMANGGAVKKCTITTLLSAFLAKWCGA